MKSVNATQPWLNAYKLLIEYRRYFKALDIQESAKDCPYNKFQLLLYADDKVFFQLIKRMLYPLCSLQCKYFQNRVQDACR